jgi:DNA-binding NtrC family response regulator
MLPKLLLILSPDRKDLLLQALDGGNFQIECESNPHRAEEILGGPVRFDLLFLDAEFSDGAWQSLLKWSREHGTASVAVVCTRVADHHLWGEVLQSGAYDLLVEPFEHQEVARIVDGALNSTSLVPPLQR